MTSSSKKKRERKKDFKKPKLKVGKTRPKAANQTDTNFNAKAIVLNQQLNVDAPTAAAQFHHQVSLLSSRTDSQRRDSLAFLTTYLTSTNLATTPSLPITSSSLLDKLCPLVLDGNPGVRSQLLKLLQVLPTVDIQDQVSRMLPHIRAGLTHLSRDIRMSSIDVLAWLDAVAGLELVSCPGGWYKTLECFTIMLGWRTSDPGNWTANKSTIGDSKSAARIITVLAEFLETGLVQGNDNVDVQTMADTFPLWHIDHHRIPTKSNAYSYLNLFGPVKDGKDQMLEDREDRIRVYATHFQPLVDAGIATTKKEGGELGRATGLLSKVLDRASLYRGNS